MRLFLLCSRGRKFVSRNDIEETTTADASGCVVRFNRKVYPEYEALLIKNFKNWKLMSCIRFLSATSALMFCAACSFLPQPHHYVQTLSPQYDPTTSARIRVLASNGAGVYATIRPDSACHKSAMDPGFDSIKVNDGGFFSAYKYSSQSFVIGMTPSPRPGIRIEVLYFKDFIKEYVIPAEKPFTVSMGSRSEAGSRYFYCNPPSVTFVPQPGRDYDVFMRNANKRCWIAIRRIDTDGADEPVKPSLAPKCSTASPILSTNGVLSTSTLTSPIGTGAISENQVATGQKPQDGTDWSYYGQNVRGEPGWLQRVQRRS